MAYLKLNQKDAIFRYANLAGKPLLNLAAHSYLQQKNVACCPRSLATKPVIQHGRKRQTSCKYIYITASKSTEDSIPHKGEADVISPVRMIADSRVVLSAYYRKYGFVPVTKSGFWEMMNETGKFVPLDEEIFPKDRFNDEVKTVLHPFKRTDVGTFYTWAQVEEYQDEMIDLYGILLETLGDSQGSKRFASDHNICLRSRMTATIFHSPGSNFEADLKPILAMMDDHDLLVNCVALAGMKQDGATSAEVLANTAKRINMMSSDLRTSLIASNRSAPMSGRHPT